MPRICTLDEINTNRWSPTHTATTRLWDPTLCRLTDEVFEHWGNSLDYRDRFAYDPAGNRVEKSRDAGRDGSIDARTAYRFDVNDRLIDELAYASANAPESRTTYTYDYTQNTGYSRERFVNGSSSTRPTVTHVYTYDLQGRLFTATVTNYNDAGTASSITRSTYDYGHTGIRVSALKEIDSTADGTFGLAPRSSTWSITTITRVTSKSSARVTTT